MMHASFALAPGSTSAIGLSLAGLSWLAMGSGDRPAQKERVFELPFPAGKSYVCLKASGTEDAKSGESAREAIDFDLPEQSVVVAAAGGRVVEVREDSSLSGESDIFERQANKVVIDHGEGLFTKYLHLAENSVDVEEGAYVKAGQKIAQSGRTGRTAEPKLRFSLCDVWGHALPVHFADLKGGLALEKKPCFSKNEDESKVLPPKKSVSRFGGATKEKKEAEAPAPPRAPPTSTLSEDAFAFNGVELTCALPANVYEYDWTYVITGRVTNDQQRVTLFISKRDDDQGNVAFFIAPVSAEKTFALPMRLADQAEKLGEGGYKYAITTVPADGNFTSAKALALVIAKQK